MRERSGRQDVPERSGPKGWRGVLAQRTPPMRAAAKRRSQAELGWGVGPRRGVYGALAGRLTAEHALLTDNRCHQTLIQDRTGLMLLERYSATVGFLLAVVRRRMEPAAFLKFGTHEFGLRSRGVSADAGVFLSLSKGARSSERHWMVAGSLDTVFTKSIPTLSIEGSFVISSPRHSDVVRGFPQADSS